MLACVIIRSLLQLIRLGVANRVSYPMAVCTMLSSLAGLWLAGFGLLCAPGTQWPGLTCAPVPPKCVAVQPRCQQGATLSAPCNLQVLKRSSTHRFAHVRGAEFAPVSSHPYWHGVSHPPCLHQCAQEVVKAGSVLAKWVGALQPASDN